MCKLPPEQAAAVYTRITGKDKKFNGHTTLAAVYRTAIDDGFVDVDSSRKMGFK
jgi:hypothetical protein